ncbi:phage replisome organizer N-terminal domain-containing protein [Clostridium cochlearium]|uniref:Phage replisome organizer n=1 Tax=Clostridium cochlearium TaxID=1494 RepID=A0A2X2W701_CLOCO|nr:phage replisome organizer N-terminal domain-containing protein [Clostridium cochlearium]SQB33423.1 phage replisome organizer [Clostridium cochlearium]
MAEVKWIKIVTDIFDDEKILLIESMPEADSIIVIWFKLLCLAGKNNNSGVFMMNDKIAYTDEMLATIFRRPLNTVRLAINTFERFGMVEIIDNVITIPNWSKHQTLDQLEERKEYMREYMRGYREKQKLLASGKCKVNSKTNSKANVSSLEGEGEEDIDIDKDKNKINWNNILESWNSLPDTINKIRTISGTRRDKVKTRMKNLDLTEEDILKAIEKIKESDFLQGQNDRNWTIKFDWLFKNDVNVMKVLEGNYDNKKLTKSKYEDGIKKDNFNSYEQRDYDFDDLEKKLLGWDKEE